jgi:hypothetical protein
MRSCQLTARKSLLPLAALLFLLTGAATETPAQRGRTPLERRIENMDRQREQYERDTLRDKPNNKSERDADQKSARAIAVQVKQDFEQLQAVYNNIVMAMSANTALDYRFISESTAEIMKRASRLKSNLVLPAPKDAEHDKIIEAEASEDQMKPKLKKLCLHIVSFVTNPMFETSGILDIEQSRKASLDLESIIKFSESIAKSADRLAKNK